MWNEIVINLGKFPNAVLTGIDTNRYPYSIRCTPKVDEDRQVLHVLLPSDTFLQPGPADLLCHSHNDQVWDLKAFQVLGKLEQGEQDWIYYPEQFVPGAGLQGPLDQIRALFKARADAKKYLQKRNLPRPKVQWDELNQVKAEARQS